MDQEKEASVDLAEDQEHRREERRFRHRVGYAFALTSCVMLLSFMFLVGWSVIVQGKDLASGPAGQLLSSVSQVIGLIF